MDSIKGIVRGLSQPRNVSRDPNKQYWVQEITIQSTRYGNDGTAYTNTLPIQVKGQRMNDIKQIQVGMEVEADFFINGREYPKKDGSGTGVFVSLDLSKITVVTQVNYGQQGQPMNQVQPQQYQQPAQSPPLQYPRPPQGDPRYQPQQGGVIPPTQVPNYNTEPIPGIGIQTDSSEPPF